MIAMTLLSLAIAAPGAIAARVEVGLYAEPAIGERLATLSMGQPVEVVALGEFFAEVSVDGRRGFVLAQNLAQFGSVCAHLYRDNPAERGKCETRVGTSPIPDERDLVALRAAKDAERRYSTAHSGTMMDRCVHASLVKAAYIHALDDAAVRRWTAIEAEDCRLAGVPHRTR